MYVSSKIMSDVTDNTELIDINMIHYTETDVPIYRTNEQTSTKKRKKNILFSRIQRSKGT